MDYSKLLKKAFDITVHHPLLWVFGLFVIGTSNLNFLYFQDVLPVNVEQPLRVAELAAFFQQNPLWLGGASLLLLVVAVGGLVVTNWSRVMLVLSVQQIIETRHMDHVKAFVESRKVLKNVIQVSLTTTFLMLVVAVSLLVPPFLLRDSTLQPLLSTIGIVFFVPLAFTISCVNIFTVFFAIIFRKNFLSALNLGTDLFISRWTSILGLTVVLMVIYICCFVAGASLIYLLKLVLGFLVPGLPAAGYLLQAIVGLMLWVLLGGLNVFFNTSLILLFFELITPVKTEEKKAAEIVPATAGSA